MRVIPLIGLNLALVAGGCHENNPQAARPDSAAVPATSSIALSNSSTTRVTTSSRPFDPMTDKVQKSDAEWRQVLDPEQYRVLRKHGTERAFTGALWDTKDPGAYVCAGCGLELFRSDHKFDSGTGWPSYWQPAIPEHVATREDRSLFMKRVEVHCARCEGHLGHVFEDGPAPTGLRYCINSASLRFEGKSKP